MRPLGLGIRSCVSLTTKTFRKVDTDPPTLIFIRHVLLGHSIIPLILSREGHWDIYQSRPLASLKLLQEEARVELAKIRKSVLQRARGLRRVHTSSI